MALGHIGAGSLIGAGGVVHANEHRSPWAYTCDGDTTFLKLPAARLREWRNRSPAPCVTAVVCPWLKGVVAGLRSTTVMLAAMNEYLQTSATEATVGRAVGRKLHWEQFRSREGCAATAIYLPWGRDGCLQSLSAFRRKSRCASGDSKQPRCTEAHPAAIAGRMFWKRSTRTTRTS